MIIEKIDGSYVIAIDEKEMGGVLISLELARGMIKINFEQSRAGLRPSQIESWKFVIQTLDEMYEKAKEEYSKDLEGERC